jgi:predicted MFS family arabinose efflux permease
MLAIRPLRSSTFRHLAAGYWVNELGNWFGEIALAILVFDRTRSPLATATLFLVLRFLPALLAPLLTVRVEALPPRVTLAFLYALEGAFFAGMAILAHHFSLPAILGLGAIDGVLAITAKALTRGISATWLLERELLREGNAILNLGAMVSMAAGPALGGVAVAWKGASTALIVDAATFLVTAAIIATAPGLRIETDHAAGFRGRVRAGLDVLRAYSAVRRLMVAVALVFLLASIPIPIEVVFAKETLHAGDRGYGLLLGAWGLGMVVGGGAFAVFTQARLIRLLAVSTVLALLGYTGLAASPTLAVACIFSALGGIGNGAGWITVVTAVQERIPVSTQSAVMSVLEGITQLMPAIGFIIGGAITAATSPRAAYAVSALGVALVVLAIAMHPIDRARLSPVAQDPEKTADISGCVSENESNPSVNTQELIPAARTLPVTDL